jgi:endonuclease YncB( thermonuclease family)
VRFEGIDALETHFKNHHQDLTFANAARELMLQQVGFTQVEFFPDRPNKVQHAEPHPLPGYVLATGIEANGRIVAQVYPGTPDDDLVDGGRVFVDDERLDRSVNAALIRAGLAYGEFYTTMPFALIAHLRDLVTEARARGAGFWPSETVGSGTAARPASVADLENMVIFPKLYRRLVDFFTDNHTDLAAFDTWIRAQPDRDDPAQLPSGERGHLHDLYQVDDNGISLRHLPEELIFLE